MDRKDGTTLPRTEVIMRLEYRGGASKKFWQVDQSGSILQIRWGRIGTAGQTQEKTFASPADAKRELQKLVTSKEQKGYAQVSESNQTKRTAAPKKTSKKTAAAKKTSKKTAAPKKTATPKKIPATVSVDALKRVQPALGRLSEKHRLPLPEWKKIFADSANSVTRKNLSLPYGYWGLGADLNIEGSLEFYGTIVVLGDLKVGRVIEFASGTDALVVGGDVHAKGIICRNHTDIRGTLSTEVLFVESAGLVRAEGGITADLIILEDPTAKLVGKYKAKHCITLDYPKPKPLADLRKLLSKGAFGVLDDAPGIFDCTHLIGTLSKGKPWRA